VAHPALGDKSKISLAPLHIKLGLIKTSVEAMYIKCVGFAYLKQKFPKISGQEERKNFLWSTNYATIRRPRL
jgi:hypothetical protein